MAALLRSLPRFFVPGCSAVPGETFEVPDQEYRKLHQVLRLSSGDEVAILPNDGTVLRGTLKGRTVLVSESHVLATETPHRLTLALGMPRPEKLEESVRMATELGAQRFVVFPAARTVVKWDESKWSAKLDRLRVIAQEACEVAFRSRLPEIARAKSLDEVLRDWPEAVVLSETEGLPRCLTPISADTTLVIGPEGGWAPQEVALIGNRAVTLGPRVLRVDTAVACATSIALAAGQFSPVAE